jgi:hypothetical protein
VGRRRLRAVDWRRQAARLPFQAGHGARTAQALRLAQPVALARQAAELPPEEPDAALARRREAPVARDVPGAAVGAAVQQPEAAPDGAAGAGQRVAEPADAEVPPPEAVAVRDVVVRRQAAGPPSEEVPLAAVWAFRRDRFPPGARPARQPEAHPHSAPARGALRDA